MTSQPKHPTPWRSVAHFVRDANNRDVCRIEPPELAARVVAAINAQETPAPTTYAVHCQFCHGKLSEHAESRGPDEPIPKVPCLGLRAHFIAAIVPPPSGPGEAGEPTGDDLLEIWDSAQHRYVAQREPHDCPIEEFARRALFQAGKAHGAALVTAAEARATVAEGELARCKAALDDTVRRFLAESDANGVLGARIASLSAELEALKERDRAHNAALVPASPQAPSGARGSE
jgi:hypothetical protein